MMQVKTTLLFIVLTSCFCHTGGAQEADNRRFMRWMVKDPISSFKNFGKTELLGLGVTGLTVYSLTYVDKKNSQNLQKSLGSSNFLNNINDIGQPLYAGSFAMAVFGTSLLTNNTKFQDAAFTSLQSVFYNHLTVGVLKFTFARARPYEGEGTRDFDFFESTHTSFPSGHTSTAFAIVTPWVMYYNHPAMYGLYAIPAAVGIGRISQGEHWLSDVTTAAIIGTYWGYYLSKKHLNLGRGSVDVSPITFGKGGGVRLEIQF